MKHKISLWISLLVIPALLLAACAAPTPEVIKEEVVVEKQVPVTVEVEKEVVVEKKVVQTVEVEKEVIVEKVVGPKILKVRLYGDIQNMDPAHQISENDGVVANAVMEGLVRYCPNSYELCNELAESIEQ